MKMFRTDLLLGVMITVVSQGACNGESVSKIAFQQFAGGPLLVMDVDGSNQKQLTSAMGRYPTWSPDGTKLAFAKGEDIYMISLDGGDETRLTQGLFPAWSPDGRQIAYSRIRSDFVNADIYVADIHGNNERKVTEGMYPSWSPGGDVIAYSKGGLSKQWAVDRSTKIYTVGIDGSDQRELMNGLIPSWSPDGSKILFMRVDGGPLFGGESSVSIYVMDDDGSNQVRLVEGVAATEAISFGLTRSGSWSPDGSRIVFAQMAATGAFICVMDADGSNPVKLTEGVNPSWSPFIEATTVTEDRTWGRIKSDAP